jgi:hypothetical protein
MAHTASSSMGAFPASSAMARSIWNEGSERRIPVDAGVVVNAIFKHLALRRLLEQDVQQAWVGRLGIAVLVPEIERRFSSLTVRFLMVPVYEIPEKFL